MQTNNPRVVGWGFLLLGGLMFIICALNVANPDAGMYINDVYTTNTSDKIEPLLFTALFPIIGLLILVFSGKGNDSTSTTANTNTRNGYQFRKVIRLGRKSQPKAERQEPVIADEHAHMDEVNARIDDPYALKTPSRD